MSRRNTLLELWRFFFCIAVLGLHFFNQIEDLDYFHAGYLGVEFFFLVSGYFIGSYYEKHQAGKDFVTRIKSVYDYALSRLKRLYPFYLLALCLMLAVRTYITHYHLSELLSLIKSCLAEFFMLQWTPLGKEVLISAGWFVPAVFFGGLFFVLLLALTGKAGGFLIAPLLSFFIYRYYFRLIGKIDVIFSYHSILRGLAGIGFGVFLYFICAKLRLLISKTGLERTISIIFCLFANLIFLGIFIYTNYGHRSKWDFLVIVLYGLGLLLLMSSSVTVPRKLEQVFAFLGKTTYPVYIFQMPIIVLIFAL
jgi:peptidoglycan/LPS O-acetylase OafA/YrhL